MEGPLWPHVAELLGRPSLWVRVGFVWFMDGNLCRRVIRHFLTSIVHRYLPYFGFRVVYGGSKRTAGSESMRVHTVSENVFEKMYYCIFIVLIVFIETPSSQKSVIKFCRQESFTFF